jgi:hypothetical protein
MNTGDTFISVAFLAVLMHEVGLFARCSPEWRQDTAVQEVDESVRVQLKPRVLR